MSEKNYYLSIISVFILILMVPFGIAVQNFLAAILLIFIGLLGKNESIHRSAFFLKPAFLGSLGFILWTFISTALNPSSSVQWPLEEPVGYFFWIAMPVMVGQKSFSLSKSNKVFFCKFFAILVFAWGGLAWSQYLFDWKIVGSEFASGGARARGFYSHPLSLAYASLLLWPIGLCLVLAERKRTLSWLVLGGAGMLILYSQSRMVQAICGLYTCFAILRAAPRKHRLSAILLLSLAGVGLWTTDNMISNKFKDTLSIEGVDRFSSYPDDRVAFWHAHILMVQERPFLGHGFAVDVAYRQKYFDQLGLNDFSKNYPAHNVFLQVLTNGGIIGLCFFLIWFACTFGYLRSLKNLDLGRRIAVDAWVIFFLASLTQNSIQDACVRNSLTALLCLLIILTKTNRHFSK